jgi:hypothetical protein
VNLLGELSVDLHESLNIVEFNLVFSALLLPWHFVT